jgi:CubicO group peptidase (beta-lactamase class C family)
MFVVNTYADTILNGIRDSKLLTKKQYRYSDLGFILLAKVVERIGGLPLDEFAARNFYDRLGASTLGYLPVKRFPQGRIVPTSNDTIFRKQWLQGYVHDENAALAGGVSGHAGLFGNAGDLAKLMQMYLNKGTYGGERYIQEETIEDFTSAPFRNRGNRRGIGFDKPDLEPNDDNPMSKIASAKSFGHTGFTGTMTWADPETGLLFIFLSNRVCPDATNNKLATSNLRSRIYEVFVRAIDTKE